MQDATGHFDRVQVKTALAKPLKKRGYAARFSVPLAQLATPQTPEIYYVFVVRYAGRWSDFVIVPRADLFDEHELHGVGSVVTIHGKKALSLYLSFRADDVICSMRSFQRFRNNFEKWQPIAH